MSKINCPWDMCRYNARCHDNVPAECTKENVNLKAYGDKDQFLKCEDFESVLKTEEELNNEC